MTTNKLDDAASKKINVMQLVTSTLKRIGAFIKRRPFFTLFILFLLWMLHIYIYAGKLHFKEEIQLSSGEMIVVDRRFILSSMGGIGGTGGWESNFNSMEIIKPKHKDNPAIWQTEEELIPVLMDRDPKTKEWFVLSSTFSCAQIRKMGKPKAPYVEDRWRNGKWQRIALSPEHMGRDTNIYTGMRSGGEFWKVTWEAKVEENKDGRIAPMYKNIINDENNC